MEKKTLSNILEGKIFNIPDYQRGYAWGEDQWKDFIQDIDALIDENIISHYTGTIVIYQPKDKPTDNYGISRLEIVDVIDGQQRLTSSSIYLSVILNELINLGENNFSTAFSTYLYIGAKSKLVLNNDTADFYFDLISKGGSNVHANSIHQKRLLNAYEYFRKHLKNQLDKKKETGVGYLKNLFDAITRKLNFSFYTIDEESEIGMTFELMNSRGKDLSVLELLKNYLMHWVYRNADEADKKDLTKIINKAWKEVYINVANCNGSENQCLRIAWTLYVSHTPKNWDGYSGFKSDYVIPLRYFNKKSKEDTRTFISEFVTGLAHISKHYSAIIQPIESNLNKNEYNILTKIINAGNIANYLPLMVAVRIDLEKEKISQEEYIDFLKSLEVFSYRVFLWEGKRSNAALSSFYRWSDDIFSKKHGLQSVIDWIYGTINWYSNENNFRKQLIEEFHDWYRYRRLLKYTLFEYENWLLFNEGKGAKPKLKWNELTDATIEHILPQTPDNNSNWLKKWNQNDRDKYTHDISNLVLTKDNSHYYNFDFYRKKGNSGVGHCYSNSDIRQERKISEYANWTVETCKSRRKDLVNWIIQMWGIDKHYVIPDTIAEEEEDDLLPIIDN